MLVEKMNMYKFDLIVLDVMMPGDNGLKLTKEIRLDRKYQLFC